MKPYRKFAWWFQIRWAEPLGRKECPYLYRWTLILFGYSVRLHHWIKSDDKRYFHDHSCNFTSIVLKGQYDNVMPQGRKTVKAISSWRSNAKQRHYLDIPTEGAWTLLICGRPHHKWGFYVKNKRVRPLKYFHKYGTIQDENYQ